MGPSKLHASTRLIKCKQSYSQQKNYFMKVLGFCCLEFVIAHFLHEKEYVIQFSHLCLANTKDLQQM